MSEFQWIVFGQWMEFRIFSGFRFITKCRKKSPLYKNIYNQWFWAFHEISVLSLFNCWNLRLYVFYDFSQQKGLRYRKRTAEICSGKFRISFIWIILQFTCSGMKLKRERSVNAWISRKGVTMLMGIHIEDIQFWGVRSLSSNKTLAWLIFGGGGVRLLDINWMYVNLLMSISLILQENLFGKVEIQFIVISYIKMKIHRYFLNKSSNAMKCYEIAFYERKFLKKSLFHCCGS